MTDSSLEGHMVVVRPREAWVNQAREALQVMQMAAEARGGRLTLGEFADLDYPSFCLMIEAMHALGARFSTDILERAQMRPVDELLT